VLLGADRAASAATEIDRIGDAGASIEVAHLATGPVFENVETSAGRIQTCVETSGRIPVSVLPGAWTAAPAWMLVPVADELGPEWAVVPAPDAVVAVGWQGMLRELVRGERVRRRSPWRDALVERADIVGVSHHDIDPGTRIDDLLAMLKPGALLVLTKGASGGVVWRRAERSARRGRHYPALTPSRTVDPTGAGDTFLATLLATRLMPEFERSRRLGGDLRFASAAGSLVVEGPGLSGVPDLAAVVRRTRESLLAG
jgi:hypothetical protein